MRDEWTKDLLSLEAEKISAIQISTGSQYFRIERAFDTARKKTIFEPGSKLKPHPFLIPFAKTANLWHREALLCANQQIAGRSAYVETGR
jgi:hypothetical protein